MLQDIRKNVQGTAAKIVVGLIVISFSIFGIESILVGGGGGGVAEVNGEEISPQELQQAINTQKRRLISMLGDRIDPTMLDDQFLSAQALDGLIGRRLLAQSAESMKLAVSEKDIGRMIAGMEQFQINGKFSPEIYSSVLSSAGYTPAYFKKSLREDIALNQLRSGLAGSEFVTPVELALNARISAEQRDLRYLTIPLKKFMGEKNVSDEQIESYYDTHQAEFRTLESVYLDYIELAVDDFRVPVEEAALLEAYQLEIETSQYQTENRVSHILFEADPTANDDALQQRITAASEKLGAGVAFSEVAAEFSDDVGSAASGGDLGYTSGDSFPPEMEQAIAQLEPNTVSAPVQTEAGTHLIMVTERREGRAPSLDEMRPALEDQLQRSVARGELLRTVEALKDLVFNAEDLSVPAAELDLTVERSEAVVRDQIDGLFAHPSLLAAAFSEEVLEAGHNSEVIELEGDKFVVLHVREHKLPKVKPLATVRDEIAAIITETEARAAVAAAATAALQKLRSGASVEELANSEGYAWQVELGADRSNTTLPREVLQRAFEMPVPIEGGELADFVMTDNGDAQLISLVRVSPGQYDALEATRQVMLQEQVSTESARLLDAEFQRGLRDAADITVM